MVVNSEIWQLAVNISILNLDHIDLFRSDQWVLQDERIPVPVKLICSPLNVTADKTSIRAVKWRGLLISGCRTMLHFATTSLTDSIYSNQLPQNTTWFISVASKHTVPSLLSVQKTVCVLVFVEKDRIVCWTSFCWKNSLQSSLGSIVYIVVVVSALSCRSFHARNKLNTSLLSGPTGGTYFLP